MTTMPTFMVMAHFGALLFAMAESSPPTAAMSAATSKMPAFAPAGVQLFKGSGLLKCSRQTLLALLGEALCLLLLAAVNKLPMLMRMMPFDGLVAFSHAHDGDTYRFNREECGKP